MRRGILDDRAVLADRVAELLDPGDIYDLLLLIELVLQLRP
jgi:hypothetical protein